MNPHTIWAEQTKIILDAALKLTGDIIRPADIDMSSAGINLIDILILTRKKSLVLWGPTRMGKTLLARCFGKHSYFGGLFNLDQYDKTAEYAVFDDLQGNGVLPFIQTMARWTKRIHVHRQIQEKTKHQVRKILSILQQHRPQRRERCRQRLVGRKLQIRVRRQAYLH